MHAWLSRISSDRIEASVPLFLGAHGLTVHLVAPVPSQVTLLYALVAGLGVAGLAGWRSRRAVLLRAYACLLVAVVVQTMEPQLVSSMLQWYYCVAAVYALLLSGWTAASFGPATGACYLVQETLSADPMPLGTSGLRAVVLTALGLVMYVTGRAYRLERDRAERRRLVAEKAGRALEHAATHDPLTGLANRTLLLREMDWAVLDGEHGWDVLVLGLDRFTTVNDALGHQAGDQVLLAVADRLRELAGPDALVARLGGDEFALLRGHTDGAAADAAATRMLESVGRPVVLGPRVHEITASVGVAVADPDVTGPDLLRAADVAMHAAKSAGRNRFVRHEAGMSAQAGALLELEGAIRRALRDEEFWLAYQPVVDLLSGQVGGVEALARWTPGGEVVAPDVFIPLTEEMGLIDELGRHVLARALEAMSRFRHAGLPIRYVAVNVSPLQLRDRGLPDLVASLLATNDLPASCLTLELTESAVMTTSADVRETLTRLRLLGVRISLDDFGTGYSSLAHLRRLPVSEVKIDRSFVAEMDVDDTVARLVLSLARDLGLHTVAEGVETAAQAELLRELGCRSGQGYHFGRPVPEHEVAVAVASVPPAAADRVGAATDRQ